MILKPLHLIHVCFFSCAFIYFCECVLSCTSIFEYLISLAILLNALHLIAIFILIFLLLFERILFILSSNLTLSVSYFNLILLVYLAFLFLLVTNSSTCFFTQHFQLSHQLVSIVQCKLYY